MGHSHSNKAQPIIQSRLLIQFSASLISVNSYSNGIRG
jgi:hypothetical protein